ncbi:MAG: WecB/TagA/CpsF family glycosyltransferase [Burkholderiaceae bacterium]
MGVVVSPSNVPDLSRPTYSVLGLPFDAVTMAQALRRVEQAVSGRRRCFISTPNVNFAMAARHDAAFRQSVLCSDLVLADGQPIVWAARLAGVPIAERVSGAGLFERLQQDAAVPIKVYFFGGPDGAAQAAHEALNRRAGPLRSVGFCAPGFGSTAALSEPAFIDPINAAQPDFLVVALGAKKGQDWIVANLDRLQVPVISHLGAVVNFTAGTVQRAPAWVQRLAGEWLWRIAQEPQLWRRYWDDGRQLLALACRDLLPAALARLLRRRGGGPASGPAPEIACVVDGERARLRMAGWWADASAERLHTTLAPLLGRVGVLEIDARGLIELSPRIHAMLLQMEGSGVALRLAHADRPLATMLARCGCSHWLAR